jgi:hypothetical protein
MDGRAAAITKIARLSARERRLISHSRGTETIAQPEPDKLSALLGVRVVRKDDLIAMKRRAAADPARRKSKRLRDQADIELLLGDVPKPDEGW